LIQEDPLLLRPLQGQAVHADPVLPWHQARLPAQDFYSTHIDIYILYILEDLLEPNETVSETHRHDSEDIGDPNK
jgi:hypothetical protein